MRQAAFALGLLLALGGCGGGDDGAPRFEIGQGSKADPFAEGMRALQDEAVVDHVLALLGPDHVALRDRVGPHSLSYHAEYELGPRAKELPRPKLGKPMPMRQQVAEDLRVDWASATGEDERFSLSQSTEAGEHRDVVVADETVYVRHTHRGWFHRPRETDLVEQWLNDAAWSARDAVAFVAPQAAVTVEASGEGALVTFSLAEERRAALAAIDTRAQWRAGASFEHIEGQLELAPDGTWRSLELSATYTLDGPGPALVGRFSVEAKLEPGSPAVDVPKDSQPVPERARLEVERDELLQGLRGH